MTGNGKTADAEDFIMLKQRAALSLGLSLAEKEGNLKVKSIC